MEDSPETGYKKEDSVSTGEPTGTSSAASNPNDNKNKDELIFDLIKRRYDDELQRINDLDSKAGNLIGYVSVVVGLLVGVGTFDLLGKLSRPEYYSPYFIGIGLLLISFICALSSVKIGKWPAVPNVDRLISEYIKPEYSYMGVISRVLGTMSKAVTIMQKKNKGKANKIKFSWYFLVAGLIAVVLYVAIFTLTGNLNEQSVQECNTNLFTLL